MDPRAFRRAMAPSSAASSVDAFDPACFDFSAYLGRRLGVTRGLASELLGEWLKSYEPADLG
jgi:hypothetical protein